jgi:hypothetical protein
VPAAFGRHRRFFPKSNRGSHVRRTFVLVEQQHAAAQVESVAEAVNDVTMTDAKLEEDMLLTAREVQRKIDYNELVDRLGSKRREDEFI